MEPRSRNARRIALAVVLALIAQCPPAVKPLVVRVAPPPTPQRVYTYFLLQISKAADPPRAAKGIGLTYGHCEDAAAVGATWQYGWWYTPQDCPSIENVPMIWGRNIPEAVGGNSVWLMGFNEPDLEPQIPPEAAAEVWPQIESLGFKLVAPAPSQLNPDWLVEFRQSYEGLYGHPPQLDALAMHCYMWLSEDCIEEAEWYFDRMAEWGIPELWITEFAFFVGCPPARAPEQAVEQAQLFLDWVERQPKISRYAWFAARIDGSEGWAPPTGCSSPLFEIDGAITEFGSWYKEYK